MNAISSLRIVLFVSPHMVRIIPAAQRRVSVYLLDCVRGNTFTGCHERLCRSSLVRAFGYIRTCVPRDAVVIRYFRSRGTRISCRGKRNEKCADLRPDDANNPLGVVPMAAAGRGKEGRRGRGPRPCNPVSCVLHSRFSRCKCPGGGRRAPAGFFEWRQR